MIRGPRLLIPLLVSGLSSVACSDEKTAPRDEVPTDEQAIEALSQGELESEKRTPKPRPQAEKAEFEIVEGPELHIRIGKQGRPADFAKSIEVGDAAPLESAFSVSGSKYVLRVGDFPNRRGDPYEQWNVELFLGAPKSGKRVLRAIVKQPYSEQRFACQTHKFSDTMWLQIGTKGVVAADKACRDSDMAGNVRSAGILGAMSANDSDFGALVEGGPRSIGHGGGPTRNATARFTSLTSSDGLDQQIVKRFLRRRLPRYKRCFSQFVKDRSKKHEKDALIAFTIARSGEVKTAKANGSKEMATCLEAAVKKTPFPSLKDSKPVKVRLGLAFKWDPNPPRPKRQ